MSAGASTVLDRIVAETRVQLQERKRATPVAELPSPRPRGVGRMREALSREGIGVIAEFKRRSPSAGALRERPELAEIVPAYEQGGAMAISILTEGPNFDGSLQDLSAARELCHLPLLRKDFVVDPYQLHEARAYGADAVLLIVAALEPSELSSLHKLAGELGLDVLVEVHDSAELAVALELGAVLVGVNNRDLRDFSVDVERTERLMEEMPEEVLAVSESGISSPEQLERLQGLGVQAVLVGETLMRADDPALALRKLTSFRHIVEDI
jgi:indole-3-glycerol phosphate synthase